jgi:hypothetical protein
LLGALVRTGGFRTMSCVGEGGFWGEYGQSVRFDGGLGKDGFFTRRSWDWLLVFDIFQVGGLGLLQLCGGVVKLPQLLFPTASCPFVRDLQPRALKQVCGLNSSCRTLLEQGYDEHLALG